VAQVGGQVPGEVLRFSAWMCLPTLRHAGTKQYQPSARLATASVAYRPYVPGKEPTMLNARSRVIPARVRQRDRRRL
jgi:hypothetical protein